MPLPITLAKFGGTSMGSTTAMYKSADIVRANDKIKIVVVSATSGTTNLLLAIAEDKDPKENLAKIITKHNEMANELKATGEELMFLQELYAELSDLCHIELTSKILDQILSIGERLSSILFVAALRTHGVHSKYFDVRKVMITNDRFGKAEPIIEDIALCAAKELDWSTSILVTQGFVGCTKNGETTTLGRGGSDYSAALLAEAVRADVVQIWTDVAGIMTMDPNLVPQARVIHQMSFNEAAELANFGAKVLHPATVWPAIRQKIRVFVGSTFAPELGGTWISPEPHTQPLIRAIALRKNQTLITVTSLGMLNNFGFLAKLFQILAHHHLSVDLVTTSEVSVALTIDGASLGSSGLGIKQYPELFKELEEFCEIQIEEGLALVALVGNCLTSELGFSTRTFKTIPNICVRLICQGASSHNMCFLVKQEDGPEVAKLLHREWIEL